ncbi:MAG: type III-B CRISPR module RAMP protein Cmr4 [bacterium]|nr:type III-B CRISPR module RAMP protein Cmr4 [bacterium]
MFTVAVRLFIYVETSLHPGTGRGLGGVDLPIQRETVTNYPMVQASSLKGRLRAVMALKNGWDDPSPEIAALFGRAEAGEESGGSFAGAISPGDARLVLFPVRSLRGVFAWTTSRAVLERFRRDLALTGVPPQWRLPEAPANDAVLVGPACGVCAEQNVVLEEFTYLADYGQAELVEAIAGWLGNCAFPPLPEYDPFRERLPRHLVILPDDSFRDFVTYSTEVVTRVRLAPSTKTVHPGALWTEEYLPAESLLYSPVLLRDSASPDRRFSASTVLGVVKQLDGTRTWLGGDETTGRGGVCFRVAEGEVGA